ncbi:MAG: hypothetical protein EBS56_05435, partial [Planctomycetia bacterium]|nr:hypothetical protein [Planctomycetia bacterium]
VLNGAGPAELPVPKLEDWPQVTWSAGASARRVNLDTVTAAEIRTWKPGETLLLSGAMLTGRDAAHKRIQDILASGQPLPEDESSFDDFDDDFDDDFEEEENDPDWDHPEEADPAPPPAKAPGKRK